MIRGECMYCKADTGPKPGVPWISNGVIFDKTHDVCDKCKQMVELQIKQVRSGNLSVETGKGGGTQADTSTKDGAAEEKR